MSRPGVRSLLPIISLVVLLAIWQLAVPYFQIPEFILPAPSAIAEALRDNAAQIIRHMWYTLGTLALGYALGVATGLVLAILMTLLPWFKSAIYPIVVASQTIPKIAIAPLLILWFGVGSEPKVLIVALVAFFPVLINSVSGLESADRSHLELMKSVNAGFWKIYWHIRLPAAVPSIFAGLKLALTVSVIGAVVGEWVAGSTGLGYLLLAFNSSLQISAMFATLIVLIAISAVTFIVITWIERKISWKARLDRGGGTIITGGV